VPDQAPSAPVTTTAPPPVVFARPHRLRAWCAVAAVALIAVFVTVAILLRSPEDGTTVQRGDQYAAVGLGLLLAGALWLPTRPRLRADRDALYVRGILGPYKTVPWSVVRSVEFRPRWQWARVVMAADETISLYAVQRLDAARSVAVMRALRALHAAAQQVPADRGDPGSTPA
jgi:hypothetical protein